MNKGNICKQVWSLSNDDDMKMFSTTREIFELHVLEGNLIELLYIHFQPLA